MGNCNFKAEAEKDSHQGKSLVLHQYFSKLPHLINSKSFHLLSIFYPVELTRLFKLNFSNFLFFICSDQQKSFPLLVCDWSWRVRQSVESRTAQATQVIRYEGNGQSQDHL